MISTVIHTPDFPSKLQSTGLSPEAQAEIMKVQQAGIKLDAYGQVLPEFTQANEKKIARDLLDVRYQVISALGRGQHVVYVPGSYDLVHAGHASYIMQAIDLYLKDRKELTRENLFVVALSDDDDLIQAVKPAHLTAQAKEHPRPIECAALFEHCSQNHPRLWDLATLPVDLVGFLPAPSRLGTLLGHQDFSRWFESVQDIKVGTETSLVGDTLERYTRLIRAMRLGDFASIKSDFQKIRHGLETDPAAGLWDVGSWQALMHQFIGDVCQARSSERYVRIISEYDVKYKDSVAQLMKACGIAHQFINDQMVVSTTALVKEFGWEVLVRSKLAHYEGHRQTRP